jgi:hypothetical protein
MSFKMLGEWSGIEHMTAWEISWQTAKPHLKQYGLFRNLSPNAVAQKPPHAVHGPLGPLFCPIHEASTIA